MLETDKLSRNQTKTIAALIECRTIAGAALQVGISERTIYRYLEEPEFRAALTRAEKGLIEGKKESLMANFILPKVTLLATGVLLGCLLIK